MASEGTVFRHNMDTGQARVEVPGKNEYGSWLSISPNQQWLFAGYYPGRLIIKEISADERSFDYSLGKFTQAEKQRVKRVQFNASGDRFVVSQDGNLIH